VESSEREALLRLYAARGVSWRELRERGFADYIEVLGGLGELGLRPPVAPMEGPNREARERGRALIREALRSRGATSDAGATPADAGPPNRKRHISIISMGYND